MPPSIICVWILSVAFALPAPFLTEREVAIIWAVDGVIAVVLPFCIISFCYFHIFKVVRHQSRRNVSSPTMRTWNPVQSELEDLERLQILINYSGGEKGRKILKVYRNILVIFAPSCRISDLHHWALFIVLQSPFGHLKQKLFKFPVCYSFQS